MDKIIDKIAALGIPGIVLTVVMAKMGFFGAAKLTAALAALGPGGMLGGLVTLGVIGLISAAFVQYGTEEIIQAVMIRQLQTKSLEETKQEVLEMRWISWGLKFRIIGFLDQYAKTFSQETHIGCSDIENNQVVNQN